MTEALLNYRYILAEASRRGWRNPRRQENPTAAQAAAIFSGHADPDDRQRSFADPDRVEDFVARPPKSGNDDTHTPTPGVAVDNHHPPYIVERVSEIELDLTTNYLIKGVLPAAGIGVIYGPPNSGKTWAAIDMAFAVAAGTPWQEFKTRQAAACIIAAENAHNIRQRVRMRAVTDSQTGLPLYVLSGGTRMINITDPPALESLIGQIAAVRPKFLIVDTMATAMTGNENEPDAMNAAIRGLKRLQHAMDELGTFVLAVHHCGKDESKGARGHSSLLGAVDVELKVKGDKYAVIIEGTKARTTGLMEPVYLNMDKFEFGKDEEGDPITYLKPRRAHPGEHNPETDGDPIPSQFATRNPQPEAPRGPHQQTVFRVFREVSTPVHGNPEVPDGKQAVLLATLVEKAAPQLLSVRASGRNTQEARQRARAHEAVEKLVNAGILRLSGEWISEV